MLFVEDGPGREMIKDAVSTFPDECCGFMLGRETGNDRYVTDIRVVQNSKEGDKRKRYEISGLDYMEAERYAVQNDLIILGVYHSHPNHPAIASETDRFAAQPYFSYLIISLMEGKFNDWRSWRLNDEYHFDEELLQQKENIENLKSK